VKEEDMAIRWWRGSGKKRGGLGLFAGVCVKTYAEYEIGGSGLVVS
jgi:hypothetical protein